MVPVRMPAGTGSVFLQPQASATVSVLAAGLADNMLLVDPAQRRHLMLCAAAGGICISLAASAVQALRPPREAYQVFNQRLLTYTAACTAAPVLGHVLWLAAGNTNPPLDARAMMHLGQAGFGVLTLSLAAGGIMGTWVGRRLAHA